MVEKNIEKHTKEHVVKQSGYIFLPFLHLLLNSRIVCHIYFFVGVYSFLVYSIGFASQISYIHTYRIVLYNKNCIGRRHRKKEQCIELRIEFCCLITISVNAIIYAYRHTSHSQHIWPMNFLLFALNPFKICVGPINSFLMRFIK